MVQGIPTLYDINIPGIRKLYQNQRSLLDFINFNKPSKSLEESFEEYDVDEYSENINKWKNILNNSFTENNFMSADSSNVVPNNINLDDSYDEDIEALMNRNYNYSDRKKIFAEALQNQNQIGF
tara:strand:+ start:14004 stop:14375 length:372 start_codon:yes stop_codon:yes gene_type:complete